MDESSPATEGRRNEVDQRIGGGERRLTGVLTSIRNSQLPGRLHTVQYGGVLDHSIGPRRLAANSAAMSCAAQRTATSAGGSRG